MDPSCLDICRQLEAWYATPRGQYVLNVTRRELTPILRRAFGFHLLQIGIARDPILHQDSPIHHKIQLAPEPGELIGLVADTEELPLAEDSVDTLIGHHALEFAEHPQGSLREMQRVLAPQGQLILIGFNPYSIQGLSNAVRGRFQQPLWRIHHSLSRRRVCDWLSLLGLETQSVRYIYGLPPFGRGRFRAGLENLDDKLYRSQLPMGGLYIIHALKQVHGLHRPQLKLKRRGRLVGLVPKPAATASAVGQNKTGTGGW